MALWDNWTNYRTYYSCHVDEQGSIDSLVSLYLQAYKLESLNFWKKCAFHSTGLTTSVCWAMAEKEKMACNFQLYYDSEMERMKL